MLFRLTSPMLTGNSSDLLDTEVISRTTKPNHEILKIHCANFGPYLYRKSSRCSQRALRVVSCARYNNCMQDKWTLTLYNLCLHNIIKVKKNAKIRNWTIWVPHITCDKNTRKHHTQESQADIPFSAGDHKAARNRQDSIIKINMKHKQHTDPQ